MIQTQPFHPSTLLIDISTEGTHCCHRAMADTPHHLSPLYHIQKFSFLSVHSLQLNWMSMNSSQTIRADGSVFKTNSLRHITLTPFGYFADWKITAVGNIAFLQQQIGLVNTIHHLWCEGKRDRFLAISAENIEQ